MRKKFVTVALLGTLIFTSTNFVGCTDYDDDINKLQEQVDALKSISISDLASQLQSLKDANSNLTTANAKMEAAIAEIKANIEALKEADKTLTSLVNGKVDQATYQAAINALNDKCSDLSSKVAALAALETAVNDLKANKADSSTVEELKKAVEKLQAVDSDFATRIGKLENTIENMNAVLAGKADQTTVDALAKSIEELKTSVAGIDTKIANALAPIQASVAKLQEDLAKKADAATIAADIEKVRSELSGLITNLELETAANLNDVKLELVGRIAALETAKETMNAEISGLKAAIDGLKDRISTLEKQPVTDLSEVKAAIQANQEAIQEAGKAAGVMAGSIKAIEDRLDGLDEGVGTVKKYIDDAITKLNTTIINQIETSIATAVTKLQSEYKAADDALQAKITALESLSPVSKTDFDDLVTKQNSLDTQINGENGLIKQLKDLDEKVNELITEALKETGPGTINAAIAKQIDTALTTGDTLQKAIDKAISSVTSRIDEIEADLNAVLERIQSIVFVPQYKDASGNAIAPVYRIDNKNGTVTMKFRVSPADKVADLVKLGKGDLGIFSFYKEDALQSRATVENALVATGVEAGNDAGTIVITAQASNNLGVTSGTGYYPVALKLSTSGNYGTTEKPDIKPVNNITTEYFNVSVRSLALDQFSVANQSIEYTDLAEKAVNAVTVKVDYNSGIGALNLSQCGFTQNLVIYAVECGSGNWVKIDKLKDADKATYITNEGFELVGNTAVKQISPIDINRIGNTLKVRLVDNDIFGTTGSPAAPAKLFEVIYEITPKKATASIDYGTITKNTLVMPGSSTAFDVNAKGEFVWKNASSDAQQIFVIKADKATQFTNTTVVGATAAEVLAAIKASAGTAVHKIGSITAAANEPKFDFDVDGDQIRVTLPSNAPRKTYQMSTTYNLGNLGTVVLNATLKLAYPTAEQLITHSEARWTTDGDYFVNYTPEVSNPAAKYTITHDLKTGYIYKQPNNSGITYTYEIVRNGTTTLPSGVTIPVGTSEIKFAKNVDLSKFRVKFTAWVGNGRNAAYTETFDVTMDYPITDKIATPTSPLVYKAADIELTAGLPIVAGVNLADRFGNVVIKDGKFVEYAAATTDTPETFDWGTIYDMKGASSVANANTYVLNNGVRYIIEKADLTAGGTMPLSSFRITNDGKFHLIENNLAQEAKVTVKIEVDYTYGTIKSDSFVITLESTLKK